MRNNTISKICSTVLSFAAVLSVLAIYPSSANTGTSAYVAEIDLKTEKINAGESETVDDFENGIELWTADSGSAIYIESEPEKGAFSGGSVLALDGEPTADKPLGCMKSFTKLPDFSDYESVAAAVYVKPLPQANLTLKIYASSAEDTVSGSVIIKTGVWQVVWLPLEEINTQSVTAIGFELFNSAAPVQVCAYIDYIHTSQTDGYAEVLPFSASYFKPSRGTVKAGDTVQYTFNCSYPALESSFVNYPLDGKINALRITLNTSLAMKSATLYYMLDGAKKFTEAYSSTLTMQTGLTTYYFPINDIKPGQILRKFKLMFNGRYKGNAEIYEISFQSIYIPPEYTGNLTAKTGEDGITVSGTVKSVPKGAEKICIYRLYPSENEEKLDFTKLQPVSEIPAGTSFTAVVPSADGVYKYFAAAVGNGVFVPVAAPAFTEPVTAYKTESGKKGLNSVPADTADELYADSVTIKLTAESLFSKSGEQTYMYYGEAYFINGATLAYLDTELKRMYSDGTFACLKLTYESEKTLYAAVSLLTQRYSGTEYGLISEYAVEPLNKPRLSLDAEKAALDIMHGVYSIAGEYAYVSVCGDSYEFLRTFASYAGFPFGVRLMLQEAEKHTASCGSIAVIIQNANADNADALISYLKKTGKASRISVDLITDSCAEYAFGFIKFAGLSDCVYVTYNPENTELISLAEKIDSAEGLNVAEKYAKICGISNWRIVFPSFPVYPAERPVCNGVKVSDIPSGALTIFDADTPDEAGWLAFEGCQIISLETVYSQTAASAAFEILQSKEGHIRLTASADIPKGYAVYLRMSVDYLPEGTLFAPVKIRISGTRGTLTASAELNAGTPEVIELYGGEDSAGDISRIDLYIYGEAGTTPRLCIFDVAAAPYGESVQVSTETAASDGQQTEKQETNGINAQTDGQTSAAENEGKTDTKLLIIVISVITGMFIICGTVLYLLDRRQKRLK